MTSKTDTVQFRVNPAVLAQLNAIASNHQMPVGAMVRAWVMDRLNQEMLLSQAVPKRWHADRLSIIQQELEKGFAQGPVLVVHVVPMTANIELDLAQVRNLQSSLVSPLYRILPASGRVNRSGFQIVTEHHKQEVCKVQVFKTGQIEAINLIQSKEREIFGLILEHNIVTSALSYLNFLTGLKVPLPFLITISLLRVKDYWLVTKPSAMPGIPRVSIEEDAFTLPETLIANQDQFSGTETMAKQLHPIIDEIWQASGHDRSPMFTSSGEWQGPFA